MKASLRDAIDQDVYRIDDDQYTDDDFQAMSLDELETIRLRITKKISNISASITKRKSDSFKNGEEKDRYIRLRAALSINERVSVFVKNLITKRLRMNKTTGDHFMNKAKAVLPSDVFERILNDANQEIANEGIVPQTKENRK